MVAVEDILTESLSLAVGAWFEPSFSHPFLNLQTIVVADSVKPIPVRWVDDVQIDEGLFRADDGDLFGDGGDAGGTWREEEGRQKLQEALSRLDLSENHVVHPNLDRMGRGDLMHEKKRVKGELKRYDIEFRQQAGRLPTRTEKEPMRPLYTYYRRLKTLITQMEQAEHRLARVGDNDGMGSRRPPSELLPTIMDVEETPRAGNGSSVEEQVQALEDRIASLTAEKSNVRAKLQAFQEKFVNENNRKIRFHKDILPIEREYRMYKNVKEEIMKVEAQLRDLRADT